MHPKWEELIPFYIASSLPLRQVQALERHLSTCETCRQSVEQWRAIAGAVKEEASAQTRGLPPLSAQVRRMITTMPPRPDAAVFRRTTMRPRPAFAALAAAAVIVVVAAVILAIMNGARPAPRQGSSIVALPTRSATLTPSTAALSSETSEPTARPTTVHRDLGIVTPTRQPEPSATVTMPQTEGRGGASTPSAAGAESLSLYMAPSSVDDTCTLAGIGQQPVPVFSAPTLAAEVIGYLAYGDHPYVFATDGESWYEIFSVDAERLGWVAKGSVTLNGSCANVPLPTPTNATPQDSSTCYATSSTGGSVNMYAGPGPGYEILNAFSPSDQPRVTLAADNGWYHVEHFIGGLLWLGWVDAGRVNLTGACQSLSVVPAAGYPPESAPIMPTYPPATPTAGYGSSIGTDGFNLVTLVNVGPLSAGTRVNIGSGYYDGSTWYYGIYSEDGLYAENVPESQLAYAPTNP